MLPYPLASCSLNLYLDLFSESVLWYVLWICTWSCSLNLYFDLFSESVLELFSGSVLWSVLWTVFWKCILKLFSETVLQNWYWNCSSEKVFEHIHVSYDFMIFIWNVHLTECLIYVLIWNTCKFSVNCRISSLSCKAHSPTVCVSCAFQVFLVGSADVAVPSSYLPCIETGLGIGLISLDRNLCILLKGLRSY